MKTPLPWRNFTQAWTRSLAIVAGVGLAILLIFMQLGFRAAAIASATSVQDALDYDILIVSGDYVFLAQPGGFSRDSLEAIGSVAQVQSVTPVWVDIGEWRALDTGQRWNALTLGVDPASTPFRDPHVNAQLRRLSYPDTGLADRRIRPELGPMEPGTGSELEHQRLRLVGDYEIGAGFTAGATLITGRDTFVGLFAGRASLQRVNLGLVRLQPGASAAAVAGEINRRLAPEARALTPAELAHRERNFWLTFKPVGIMFSSGVVIALIAGAAILYQVLASEVQQRLSEYATLRAIGYDDRQIIGLVVWQGQIFAILGFLPAILLAILLYAVLRELAQVPVAMTFGRIVAVLLLTSTMGAGSAMLAARKLRRADPAELF